MAAVQTSSRMKQKKARGVAAGLSMSSSLAGLRPQVGARKFLGRQRLALHGPEITRGGHFARIPAGDLAGLADLNQRRLLRLAAIAGDRAARMEAPPLR